MEGSGNATDLTTNTAAGITTDTGITADTSHTGITADIDMVQSSVGTDYVVGRLAEGRDVAATTEVDLGKNYGGTDSS